MSNKIVLVDLDGTLALNLHRYYLIDPARGKPDYKAYFLSCDQDKPNLPVIETVRSLRMSGHKVHIFSARGKVSYNKTVDWLERYKIPYDFLTMRDEGNFTPDEDLKKQWLLEKYPNYKEDILCVFDDRDKVVDMWRSLKVTCFQVAPGNF